MREEKANEMGGGEKGGRRRSERGKERGRQIEKY